MTLTTEVDASELFKLREAIKGDAKRPGASPVPSYNDIFAKLVALALQEHAALNASWTDEGVLQHAEVNIGMAVQTERGLLVPVLRNPASKPLPVIAAESAQLVERARNGNLSSDEMRGGTFTITNLGMYDIDGFTPIINLPECAILGLGRMVAKVVVIDEAAEKTATPRQQRVDAICQRRLVVGQQQIEIAVVVGKTRQCRRTHGGDGAGVAGIVTTVVDLQALQPIRALGVAATGDETAQGAMQFGGIDRQPGIAQRARQRGFVGQVVFGLGMAHARRDGIVGRSGRDCSASTARRWRFAPRARPPLLRAGLHRGMHITACTPRHAC